jgi:hypothetical protein
MRSKILLVALVLFFGLVFVSSGLADLYIINDLEGKNICITNINTLILKYKELGYEMILVAYSNLKLEKGKEGKTEQDPGADIQIVDWTYYISDTGNYYYIEGILKNVGNSKLNYVEAKAIAFDKNKKLVTLKRSYANPHTLEPGEKATFKIMIKYDERIKNFELSVNWKEE